MTVSGSSWTGRASRRQGSLSGSGFRQPFVPDSDTGTHPAIDSPDADADDRALLFKMQPLSAAVATLSASFVIHDVIALKLNMMVLAGDLALAAFFATVWWLLRQRKIPPAWANPTAFAGCCAVVATVCLTFRLTEDQLSVLYVVIVIIGAGSFLRSARWLALVAVVASSSWLVAIIPLSPLPVVVQHIFALGTGVVVAAVLLWSRLVNRRRLDTAWDDVRERQLGLERARRVAERSRERFAERLQVLHTIERSMLAAESPFAIMLAVLPKAADLVPSQAARIVFRQGEEGKALVLESAGTTVTEWSIPLEDLESCLMCRSDEGWLTGDLHGDALRDKVAPSLVPRDCKSLVWEPMVLDSHSLGGLLLLSKNEAAFSEEDADIARELADILALALRQAMLRREAEVDRLRLEATIEHIPEGVFLLDRDQHIVLANRKAMQLLPLVRTEDAESDHLPSVCGLAISSLEASSREGQFQVVEVESPQRLRIEAMAEQVESGADGGVVVVLRDVTRDWEVQQRAASQDRLAAVGQLAAGVAHDFNNILQMIRMSGELLRDGETSSCTVDEELETIIDQSERGARLVAQILDFSRKTVSKAEALHLGQEVEKIITLLRRTIREKVEVGFSVAVAGPEPWAIVDPTQLHQAITNLVLNAQDVVSDDGTIDVRVSTRLIEQPADMPFVAMDPGPWAMVEIADNGSGIPDEIGDRIYEPFFTTKAPGDGTGLGLAQVYGILKQNSGFVDYTSQEGQGTVFRLYLPVVARPAPKQDLEPEPAQEVTNRKAGRILVVEDEVPLLRIVSRALEASGYSVNATSDAAEAMELMRHSGDEIDVVLSDVVMPGLSGPELLRQIRDICPRPTFILMSGYPLDEVAGIDGAAPDALWLKKPFSIDDLVNSVTEALARGSGSE